MRSVFRFCLIAVLTTSMMAQTSAGTQKVTRRRSTQPAVTVEDIQALRQMLEQQQQQIQQLQNAMQQRDEQLRQTQNQLQQAQATATAAQDKATSLGTAADDVKQSFTKVQGDVEDLKANMTTAALQTQDEQKKLSEATALLGRFRFGGDVRVRYENFTQDGTQTRNRERIRLRFGVEGKLNEDFTAGLFVASGVLTDPTSTNETLTNMFEKKTIGFDRGYITYNPSYFKPLSITGGKFAYTWNRTPVTFDSDLNPEGFSQKLSFDIKNPIVKNLTFTGIQLLYNEASGGADSFAAGGQIASKVQIGSRWTMTPSYSILNWRNNDVILNQPTSVTGGSTAGPFAPNGVTNCTVTDAGGVRHYCSQFLYSDLILSNTIKTGIDKLPFNLLAEYLVNLNAASNASHAYYIDANLGQTKNRNDVQFGYAFIRQEQDSVISSFNESDQRAPTNIVQHRLFFNWKVAKNTTLGYTQWIGRTLDSSLPNAKLSPGILPGQTEPYLKRGQLDLVYSF